MDNKTSRSILDVVDGMLIDTRRESSRVNIELAESIINLQADVAAAREETARIRSLFLTCVPPVADEFLAGTPVRLHHPAWRVGWDACRRKVMDLLENQGDAR